MRKAVYDRCCKPVLLRKSWSRGRKGTVLTVPEIPSPTLRGPVFFFWPNGRGYGGEGGASYGMAEAMPFRPYFHALRVSPSDMTGN
ncbi:MAG: hypothetical protein ACRD18_14255 [Terriglobia bacterium]